MPDFEIREARNRDREALRALIAACAADDPTIETERPELEAIAAFYGIQRGGFWVAETQGEIVGCVGMLPAREGNGLELLCLHVVPVARRRGIASALSGWIEEEARRAGVERLEAIVDHRAEAARALFRARGYREVPAHAKGDEEIWIRDY